MGENTETLRRCRKCLTRDMAGQEEYFRTLREYIANLDEDIKAPAALYEERLGSCRQCDMLSEGMCRSCGCYVELRAAVAQRSCPWNKWKAAESGTTDNRQ